MFKVRTMNAISESGVDYLKKHGCEVGPEVSAPDAMLIRSADLHEMTFNPELLAIGRAGAGYNNIPVEQCAEAGIVVFNSPGANAEAVKEQEMMSLIMASRDVLGAIDYVRSIADRGEEIPVLILIERGKIVSIDRRPANSIDDILLRGHLQKMTRKEVVIEVTEDHAFSGQYKTITLKRVG